MNSCGKKITYIIYKIGTLTNFKSLPVSACVYFFLQVYICKYLPLYDRNYLFFIWFLFPVRILTT